MFISIKHLWGKTKGWNEYNKINLEIDFESLSFRASFIPNISLNLSRRDLKFRTVYFLLQNLRAQDDDDLPTNFFVFLFVNYDLRLFTNKD